MRSTPVLALAILLAFGCESPEERGIPQARFELSEEAQAGARTEAQTSRNNAAIETLRQHWDGETITGAMLDEIKKVIDNAEPADLEPLYERIALLDQSGDTYAPDFALWWQERGRRELAGNTIWRRDLLREAWNAVLEEGDPAHTRQLIREAAATGDPVARSWQSLMDARDFSGHDAAAFGNTLNEIGEVRALAESGDADAAFFLSFLAMRGDRDLANASPQDLTNWLEMAHEGGYRYAAEMLSELYTSGRFGVERDIAKAREWDARSEGLDSRQHAAKLRASSQNNMKQLGLVGKMFANESQGEMWPALSGERGQLAMNPTSVYPEYLADPNIYISPAHPDYYELTETADTEPLNVIRDHSYWYLGYAVDNDAQGIELAESLRQSIEAGQPFPESYDAPASPAQRTYRLSEGVERFFITDINDPAAGAKAQASIPVLIERPGMHELGANVLYLDGHVEFHKYPGDFPMSEPFIQALQSLDDLKD